MIGTAMSADDVPVCFETRGTGSPAILFVHGWSCDRRYWERQVTHFAERHQVVTVDLAGHGNSGTGRAVWTMPAFADDAVAVVEHLGLRRVVLVGHSMGGDVITAAALRLQSQVVGLVWVDTYRTLGSTHPDSYVEHLVAPLRTDFVSGASSLIRRMFLPTSDADLVEWVIADMTAAPADIAVSAFEHAIAFEPAVVAALREIQAPVVTINPDNKTSDPEALGRHGVTVVPMPGVGHFAMLEHPDLFNRILGEIVRGWTAEV
jgi:pimeloyl-ACP methyl ester carboxylesterase